MAIPLFAGFMLGLSLILPIGAQNAFVLRLGLRGEHVLAVCLTCAVSDAVLILAGVTGFAQVSALMPWAEPVMRYAGAAFLIVYGARSFKSAFESEAGLRISGLPRPHFKAPCSPVWLSPGSIRTSTSIPSC